jgi:hypothetical protein
MHNMLGVPKCLFAPITPYIKWSELRIGGSEYSEVSQGVESLSFQCLCIFADKTWSLNQAILN